MLELVYRVVQWVSEVTGAGETLYLTFGGKQAWEHHLGCFVKSVAIYTQSQALYIALCCPEPKLSAPVLLSYSPANKPPAMLLTQFIPLLHSAA